jgi:hypothetical protein
VREPGTGNYNDEQLDHYAAIVPAAPQAEAVAIPAGWKLVPEEPTDEMVDAARHFLEPATARIGRAAYRAMLAASPAPSVAGVEVTLAECPVGLFRDARTGTLALKTEYGNNDGRIDAYIVESGEFYWGAQPQTIASQRAQMVVPISAAAINPEKAR